MKRIFLLATIMAFLGLPQIIAQSFQPTTDKIWGGRGYTEKEGINVSDGNKNATTGKSWSSVGNRELVFYLHVPNGFVKAKANVVTNGTKNAKLRLRVIYPITQEVIYDNTVETEGTGNTSMDILTSTKFTYDGWYKFELTCPNPSNLSEFTSFEFSRTSTLNICTSAIYMAPSVHLWSGASSDKDAPTGASYDWAYQEVLVPSKYEHPASYWETIASNGGYMGIQAAGQEGNTSHTTLFSMWDNGDVDKDPYLPDYLRSGCLDSDPKFKINHFGGEGTGIQAIKGNDDWLSDHWVQFLYNVRPELTNVTIKGSKGQDSVIVYHNILTSAWYKQDTWPEWRYIATHRRSGDNNYISGWYSFLENFGDNGNMYRKGYWRNAYMHSLASGKWYNINHYTYGHTQGTSERDSRHDYGHGAAPEYGNCFYMETGGFIKYENDVSQYVPLAKKTECVDTIDLDRLTRRVDKAVKLDTKKSLETIIDNTGDTHDLTKWTVTGYSDQETEAEDGKATNAIDGNPYSFWTYQQKPTKKLYPHWITLKAPEAVPVNNISLNCGGTFIYWPQIIKIYSSKNGIDWTLEIDSLYINKAAKTSTDFPKYVNSQYFKIEFVQGFMTASYFKLGEIGLSCTYNINKVKNRIKEMLDNGDCLGSFPSKDLENLATVYDDGKCEDLDAYQEALSKLGDNSTRLKYSLLKNTKNIGTRHVYMLRNYYGYGYLVGSNKGGIKTLSLKGATDKSAQTEYTEKCSALDLNNNWVIVRSEKYNSYYLYNIGLKKFLDLSNPNLVSDTPTKTPLMTSGSRFIIQSSNSNYVKADPTSATKPVSANKGYTNGVYFEFYNNNYYTMNQAFCDSILNIVEAEDKLFTYKTKINDLLSIKKGIVGCLTDDSEIELIQKYYNGGNPLPENLDALYTLVDNCKRMTIDPENCLYKLKSVSAENESEPYYTMSTSGSPTLSASSKKAEQIWSLRNKFDGFTMSAQAKALGEMPNTYGNAIPTVSLDEANIYIETEYKPGKYTFGASENNNIVIGAYTSSTAALASQNIAWWEVEPVENFEISLNAVGVASLYYDFDIIIPEDVKVYAVTSVSEDGVATLERVMNRLPACTGAIIRGENNEKVTFSIVAPTLSTIQGNMLKGTCLKRTDLKKKTFYSLSTSNGNPVLKQAQIGTLNANTVYVQYDEDKIPEFSLITLDFKDVPVNVKSAKVIDNNQAIYSTLGYKTYGEDNGILIKNRKKFVK